MSELEALGPLATRAEVVAAWRRDARANHPDLGGDAAEFHRLRVLYEQRLARAPDPTPAQCLACDGTGELVVSRGFHTSRLVCRDCGGSGQV